MTDKTNGDGRGGTRVGLIDDERLVRAGLRCLLELLPAVVVVGEAETVDEALALAEAQAPDILLLNTGIAADAGVHLIERLRCDHPRIALLAARGARPGAEVRQLFERGVAGVLGCASAPEELGLALDTLARGQLYVSPDIAGRMVSKFTRRNGGTESREPRFTNRQRQILRCLGRGLTNKEIAVDLGISVKTVETHRSRVMRTLGFRRGHQLLQFAIRHFDADR